MFWGHYGQSLFLKRGHLERLLQEVINEIFQNIHNNSQYYMYSCFSNSMQHNAAWQNPCCETYGRNCARILLEARTGGMTLTHFFRVVCVCHFRLADVTHFHNPATVHAGLFFWKSIRPEGWHRNAGCVISGASVAPWQLDINGIFMRIGRSWHPDHTHMFSLHSGSVKFLPFEIRFAWKFQIQIREIAD